MAFSKEQNLQRQTLRDLQKVDPNPIIPLRIEYSEVNKLLTGYVNRLATLDRIYPTHLPTQSNFRWSTIDPPLTNFPRECINPRCVATEHEWTDNCWSLRDIVTADDDEVMVSWDHDNIEGRLGAILLDDQDDLRAFENNEDLHTITCCNMFGLDYPRNKQNPHTSVEDIDWRAKYKWQGKDTRQRVLAKNFNHGSRYSVSERFVFTIPGIERYNITRAGLLELGKRYIASKNKVFAQKKILMAHIKKTRIARNLYGARRVFYDSSEHTAKEGFNHIISSTVSHYMNETLIMIDRQYPQARLVHNAHDSLKIAFPRDNCPSLEDLKGIVERPITYQGRSVLLTASFKTGK